MTGNARSSAVRLYSTAAASLVMAGMFTAVAFAVETDRITVEDPGTQQIKFRVTSDGNVTGGNVTATSFIGDGSQLTNLPAGTQGPVGPAGPQGATGAAGPPGAPGANGSQGPKGDTGATGSQGATGPKGDKGDQGLQGIPGPSGSPDTQSQILGKIATAADSTVLTIRQGPTELSTAPKFAVNDYPAGAQKMVITAAGKIGVGMIQVIMQFSGTNSSGGGGFIAYHNNASGALPNAGDRLGYFLFGSYDGAATRNAAGISAKAEGAWVSGSSTPAYFAFETTPSGSITRSERMRVTAVGNVGIGTTSPGQKVEVNGGIRINTIVGKPTCDSSARGTFWFTQGAADAKDTAEVCAKDAANVYDWRTLY
jgi:hypothetical protein